MVYCEGHVLLVERSGGVAEFPNIWATVGGFLLPMPPAQAILEELEEEVGIRRTDIESLIIARCRVRLDPELRIDEEFSYPWKRRWLEFRGLAVLNRRVNPVINWENRQARWIPLDEVGSLNMLRPSARTLEAWRRLVTRSAA